MELYIKIKENKNKSKIKVTKKKKQMNQKKLEIEYYLGLLKNKKYYLNYKFKKKHITKIFKKLKSQSDIERKEYKKKHLQIKINIKLKNIPKKPIILGYSLKTQFLI